MPLIAVAALVAACWLVWLSVRHYSLAEIVHSIRSIELGSLLLAGALAAASYLCLTVIDWMAVRYAGHSLPYRRTALASFVSLSLGHSIGLAPLGSGAIRARYYTFWGLDAEAIAKVIVFCTVAITLGQIGFAGLALVLAPGPAADWLGLPGAAVRAIGGVCLAIDLVYVLLALRRHGSLRIRGWSFELPRWRLALGQVVVGTVNFAILAGALHAVIGPSTGAAFLIVATVFVLANCAALISHVPGGLGVIEWVILSLFPAANAFGPILIYRTVYYLVPLVIGALIFAATAFRRRKAERLAACTA